MTNDDLQEASVSLRYPDLLSAVAGGAVGVRSRVELEPLGGAGDKVFPPTYGVPDNARTRYAVEQRVVINADGSASSSVDSVVLDSVASQANLRELTLLDAIYAKLLAAPVTAVDFAGRGLFGIDRITDYEAPHRIFDALLRDSMDGDTLFRHGAIGRSITDATPGNAAALFHHSPHTLVFGGWDSTGPKGGRGAKYERAITSEIVAHNIELGVKTASRIDPVGIELKAGPLYKSDDKLGWTLDADKAIRDKNSPTLVGKGAQSGRPSQVNHGNVTPSIDDKAGGITARRIVGTTVLSFIQLRRLRFPTDATGQPIDPQERTAVADAARTALAALGVAATVLAYEQGFDLRSRCVLVPTGPLTLDLVGRSGGTETFELDGAAALALVAEAAGHAADQGLGWRAEELLLSPTDRLVTLIRKSQDLAAAGEGDG